MRKQQHGGKAIDFGVLVTVTTTVVAEVAKYTKKDKTAREHAKRSKITLKTHTHNKTHNLYK